MSDSRAPSVLIVEDEVDLARVLQENLISDGCRAAIAHDGARALEALEEKDFDLVILDVMLPEVDGFSICETVRSGGSTVPILFLTAAGGPEARIRGLEAGGDDYIEKPFSLRELMLRVQSLLRRSPGSPASPTIRFGGNRVDLNTGETDTWSGVTRRLSGPELGILRTLHENAGQEITADRILEAVWRDDVFPSTRLVRRIVERLVAIFEKSPDHPRHFQFLPGQGFRFIREPEEDSCSDWTT